MTIEERRIYGALVGHVELREDCVRRTSVAWYRAVRFRNAIGVVTLVFIALQLPGLFITVRQPDWFSSHALGVVLGLAAIWLFAAGNAWCCGQRVSECRARLIDFVSRLPVGQRSGL